MTRQLNRTMKMYDGKVYGFEVSDYGKENGYLDYHTLSKIVGSCVLNNYILPDAGVENWELVTGEARSEWDEVYQYFIISYAGYRFLEEYTDEIVYYHTELDMYLWGITHFGTNWEYVLTDIELV